MLSLICPGCLRFRLLSAAFAVSRPSRFRAAAFHFTSFRSQDAGPDAPHGNPEEALARARARAWYLNTPSATTSSLKARPATRPSQTITSPAAAESRQPEFTTFDPSRTTSLPPTRAIPPLPSNIPHVLRPLHTYLTSAEAAEVLDPNSVVFLHTPSAPIRSVGPGELIRGESEAGARWEWVVVIQVRGTGKGVVGRAERAVRNWLHKNPLPPILQKQAGDKPKVPRVSESTDWSIIAPTDSGVCLNLFTGEGRERWDLEELWSGRSTLLNRDQEG